MNESLSEYINTLAAAVLAWRDLDYHEQTCFEEECATCTSLADAFYKAMENALFALGRRARSAPDA